jgi:hypothetical protein
LCLSKRTNYWILNTKLKGMQYEKPVTSVEYNM